MTVNPKETLPPDNPTWPWSPATTAQGFLSGRWERRNGDVFAGGPPVVLSTEWSLTLPVSIGDIVGACGIVGRATSWAIVEGNGEGFWAIDSNGVVTVAGLGMFDGVIYEISVTASNANGTSIPASMFIRTILSGRRGAPLGPISPIAGGDDTGAKVSVSSGVPRS